MGSNKIIKLSNRRNFYRKIKQRLSFAKRKFPHLMELRWIRNINIQSRLIISFLLLSSIPLIITSLISYKISSEAIQTKIETYSVKVMNESSMQLENQLAHIESLCEELAMTEEMQKELPSYNNADKIGKFQIEDNIISKFVEQMRNSSFNASSDITSIDIITNKDTIIGVGQNNYNLEQLTEIFNYSKNKDYKYHYRVIQDLNGNFEISVNKVIKNHSTGAEIGTLILTFKQTYISDICKKLSVGDNAEVFIINSKGKIISSSNPSKIKINEEYMEKNLIEKILDSSKQKDYSFSMDINGEADLVAYSEVGNYDWFIVNSIPYKYLQAESKILMWRIIFIGLICLIFAILASFIISFSISMPLKRLKDLMKEVRKGKLDIEVEDDHNDEITEITKSFDDMILSIRNLTKENIETQKEIVYKLGQVTEARSQETGNHIRRVAHYSRLIALKYGMSSQEAEVLKMASTLHDIGKVSIPDRILLKPGKLTEEEFELMKTHTIVGYDILASSNKPILKMASIIALQHHERYDGTGYPRGLRYNEIEIHSKIVSLTDVFDALGTERVYKRKWEFNEIVDYVNEQRGKQFDPEIVDIFLNNLDDFKRIQNALKD